jgi:hypothetical protein
MKTQIIRLCRLQDVFLPGTTLLAMWRKSSTEGYISCLSDACGAGVGMLWRWRLSDTTTSEASEVRDQVDTREGHVQCLYLPNLSSQESNLRESALPARHGVAPALECEDPEEW